MKYRVKKILRYRPIIWQIILLFCFSSSHFKAQIKTGEMAIGGALGGGARTITQTADKGFLMAGSTASYSYTRTGDNYLFKLDSNGKLLWSKAGENGNSQEEDGIYYIINTQDSGIMILINYSCVFCNPSQFVNSVLNDKKREREVF